MTKTNIFFLCLLALLASSCATLTGYQDGRAVGKSKVEGGLSLNVSRSPDFINDDVDNSLGTDNGITFPNLEIFGRYGVSDKLDVGAKINSNLNFSLTTKYQLIGDQQSKAALAIGADFGTFGLISSLWNVQLPLYMSIHPVNNIGIYLAPRYIVQFSAGDLTTDRLNYLGGNTGILFGKKNKVGVDFGYYNLKGLDTFNKNIFTFGVGGKFIIGGSDDDDDGSSAPVEKKKRKKRKK